MDEHLTTSPDRSEFEPMPPEGSDFNPITEGASAAKRLVDPESLVPTFSSAAAGPYAPGEKPKPAPQWPDEIRARDDEIRSLRHKATHDELTGLPNRMYLLAQLQNEVSRNPGNVALLFSDNDGLKLVNDTSGHAAGDALIKTTGMIIERSLRRDDGDTVSRFVARLGGDEFVSLVPNVSTQQQLDSIKQRLETALANEGILASIGARIHVSGETAEEFLDAVDKLMYQEKLRRKNEA
jgi:diguanylate cyclase (GGDEF)-like protein